MCGVKSFTYGELKANMDACLAAVREEEDGAPTDEQMGELKGYMQAFMQDVEEDEDIECWERLKDGRFSFVPNISAWLNDYRDRQTQTFNGHTLVREEETLAAIQEAIDVLGSPMEKLPMIMPSIKTDLGLMLVERRLKNGSVA